MKVCQNFNFQTLEGLWFDKEMVTMLCTCDAYTYFIFRILLYEFYCFTFMDLNK